MRTLTRPLIATSLAATVLLTACGAPRDEADEATDSSTSEETTEAASCDKESPRDAG